MCSKLDRINRRIGDADVGEAVDLEVSVDDTALTVREHRARAARVELCAKVLGCPRVPVVVGLNRRAGRDLADDGAAEWGSAAELARELESLAKHHDVYQSKGRSTSHIEQS